MRSAPYPSKAPASSASTDPFRYVQLGLSFASILVLDEGLDMFAAMRRSWTLVAGRRLEVAVLLVSCLSISVAGTLAMGLGALITVPLAGLAFVGYYEQRRQQA